MSVNSPDPIDPPQGLFWPGLFLLFCLLTVALFWCTKLDLVAAAYFYVPNDPIDSWPGRHYWLWDLIYRGDWILAGVFGLAGIVGVLLAYRRREWRIWSPRGWFLLAIIVLGSGLVVNAIFKDHWGRYRPRQVEELGGVHPYVPLLVIGEPGKAKSFPCGHCSVGFAFFGFWFIWRRRHPRLAWASLAFAVSAGTLIGIGRMTAGAHFLSDVIGSGLLMYATSWLIYYKLLDVPEREARILANRSDGSPMPWWQRLIAVGALVGIVGAVLLAKPMAETDRYRPEPDVPIHSVMIFADDARVRIHPVPLESGLLIVSRTHSFGLPGNRVQRSIRLDDQGGLVYRIEHQGLYTECDTELEVTVDPAWLDRLSVHLEEGDIHLPASVAPSPNQFETAKGAIIRRLSETNIPNGAGFLFAF